MVVVVVVFNLATSGSESHVNQIEDMHHNAGMHAWAWARPRPRAINAVVHACVCLWTCT